MCYLGAQTLMHRNGGYSLSAVTENLADINSFISILFYDDFPSIDNIDATLRVILHTTSTEIIDYQ